MREHAAAAPRAAASVPAAALPEGVDEQDAWGLVRRQKMSGIRKTIAVNMARSSSTIPHVTNFDDADITELERIRKGGLADYVGTEIKLTMMAFVMKAVAQSLKLHPMVNASVDMENEQIIYKQYVNIGVAVDTERGLVVPVMRDVDRMSIPRIAQALTTVTEQARSGQVHARRSARAAPSRSATWARSAAPTRRRSSIRPRWPCCWSAARASCRSSVEATRSKSG